MQVYISTARVKDAPQVRISSSGITPWMSLESCKEWCSKHTFSYVIKEWTKDSPSIQDKTLLILINKHGYYLWSRYSYSSWGRCE